MTLSAEARQRIETLLRADRLVVFMNGAPDTPERFFSHKICRLLDDLGLDYAHVDVSSDSRLREHIKIYGGLHAIPQLYLDGKLVGDSDAVERMANADELHAALGLSAPDRTPPTVRLTPAAARFLRDVVDGTGNVVVVDIAIDSQFRTSLHFRARRKHTIATEVDGVPLQFDLASARRADGLSIDWQDVERGPSLLIHHPRAPVPEPVRWMSPADADARVRAGTLTIVDIRRKEERALARLSLPFLFMDEGTHEIRNLAPEVPLAVLCHRGDRSWHAAEYFLMLGHRDVYAIEGGIDAWAATVDGSIPRY
ncbi:glutaredoxin domain-containing protein [Luteimonas aquatica]|uniref:glutaredoxin domain-containing protein n=1 Tax=Luteimonas aquatica TaxID=450364 RepID=UPI001F58DB91|nr:glutaredoxin domain-containing protein [Luteimonas aquatica]